MEGPACESPRQARAPVSSGLDASGWSSAKRRNHGGEGLAHGRDGGRCGDGKSLDDGFIVSVRSVEGGSDGVFLQGHLPVGAGVAELCVQEGQGVFEGGDGAGGPASLAGEGRAEGEDDGAAVILKV